MEKLIKQCENKCNKTQSYIIQSFIYKINARISSVNDVLAMLTSYVIEQIDVKDGRQEILHPESDV